VVHPRLTPNAASRIFTLVKAFFLAFNNLKRGAYLCL
jgi:hypothetical protein